MKLYIEANVISMFYFIVSVRKGVHVAYVRHNLRNTQDAIAAKKFETIAEADAFVMENKAALSMLNEYYCVVRVGTTGVMYEQKVDWKPLREEHESH